MMDVAVIGGGVAGMAAAARLQAMGFSTTVFEAHGKPGGCAGYFRRDGFSFDVGATTLVDFGSEGLGGELLARIGLAPFDGDVLPGYVAWLPDRTVTLHRDSRLWAHERLRALGDTDVHRRFWAFLDRLVCVFWAASRNGARLPLRNVHDVVTAVRSTGLRNVPMARHLGRTMGDALRAYGLREDRALVGLLSMLIEDTVHSTIDNAPLINAALGVTIRGAGLTRARGGMGGFWTRFLKRYGSLGGEFRGGCCVERIQRRGDAFLIETRTETYEARRIVCAVPAALAARLGPCEVTRALAPYLERDAGAHGGAVALYLGVPEAQLANQEFTHHQLLHDYSGKLGNGNNMFISVSAPGDMESAPMGCQAVMISTHCDLEEWSGLCPEDYQRRKTETGETLLSLARRVYPNLGEQARIMEIGTPRTFARFTRRPQGSVGGFRLSRANANQNAIPHDLGASGYRLVGDTTWPGLGTVACLLGAKIVADDIAAQLHSKRRPTNATTAQEELHGDAHSSLAPDTTA
ncbi:C-3',4' desaturase CrtD [Capsulimonas corticalis]|uniref:C-3',4' desaturase CrtD n=1 Tax=Capsulimonas corticalis TaxID=2219043 RepID=A0A402CYX1_9BACT|nr:NAD(P)/FAD-dependent oxidoreductase [Capsulimonas corticalis]BDI29634.1 C-3',4' desaturase CrtD [Capsulimonas corticalis]